MLKRVHRYLLEISIRECDEHFNCRAADVGGSKGRPQRLRGKSPVLQEFRMIA
jgi:hypothetical protein